MTGVLLELQGCLFCLIEHHIFFFFWILFCTWLIVEPQKFQIMKATGQGRQICTVSKIIIKGGFNSKNCSLRMQCFFTLVFVSPPVLYLVCFSWSMLLFSSCYVFYILFSYTFTDRLPTTHPALLLQHAKYICCKTKI